MATVVIIGILAFIAYELAIFNHYQKEPPHGGKQASPETEVSPKVEDARGRQGDSQACEP